MPTGLTIRSGLLIPTGWHRETGICHWGKRALQRPSGLKDLDTGKDIPYSETVNFGGYRLEDVEMSGSRPHPQRSIGMEGYFAGPPSGVYGPPQLTKETMRNVGTGLSFIPMTAPLGITLSLMGAENQAEAAFALAGAIPYVRAARVGWSATKMGTTAFRSFTSSNFRINLGRLTGNVPANSQAHHVFPQKYQSFFNRAGVNIHDPKFGAWWETSGHLKNVAGYNAKWAEFIRLNPNATQSQILNQGRTIMQQYGIPVGF